METAKSVKKARKLRPQDNGAWVLSEVRQFLLTFQIELMPATGAYKAHPYDPERDRTDEPGYFCKREIGRPHTISKTALVRRMQLAANFPADMPQSKDVLMAALELNAEREYRAAWQGLHERINTYVPWPDGYDPYAKLIRYIGARHVQADTDLEHFKDLHCGLRHFIMQQKRVVAGTATKDDYPITLIAYGPGETGKSALIRMLFEHVYGDFFAVDNFDLITDQFKTRRASRLPVFFLDEMERANRATKEAFKNFVSSHTLMCRGIFSDEVADDDNIASLVACTNEKPPFGLYDESSGLARRVLLLPCTNVRYHERGPDAETFTQHDALALFQGLQDTGQVIFLERRDSLLQRQAPMQQESFETLWLQHRCEGYEQPYADTRHDKNVQMARRWDLREVAVDMAEFRKMMDVRARFDIGMRSLAGLLRDAGAEIVRIKNTWYLVSHRRRTIAD